MGIQNLLKKAQRTLNTTADQILSIDGMNTVDVTLHWTEAGTIPANFHQDLLSTHGTAPTKKTDDPFKAFAHFVQHGTSTFQRFAEVKNGDIILDIRTTVNIDNKPNPRFEINGHFYTQKKVGSELTEAWDSFTGSNAATFRTLLLKPAK